MSNSEAHKVILVADDQAFIRSLLISMLRELGYRTLDAVDGNHAMQQLNLRPDAAILDHRMAGRTGLEILREIRCGRTKLARDLPVLMLTGHADENFVRIAGELDVSALLSKPVSKVQLRARLEAIARAGIELKPPQSYAEVDMAPAECAAPPRRTSNAWVLRDSIHPRQAPFVTAAQIARRAGAAARAAQGGDTHYSRLRPGMILARSLYSGGGKLLLAAGTEIDKAMVKRLARLCESNPDMEYLSVTPAKGKGL
jgi:CheY-like chemotaxis protein